MSFWHFYFKESLNRVFYIYLLILLSLAEMDERFREMDAEWEEFQEFKEFHRQKELHGRTSVIEKPRNRMDNAEGKKATLQHNEICFTQYEENEYRVLNHSYKF